MYYIKWEGQGEDCEQIKQKVDLYLLSNYEFFHYNKQRQLLLALWRIWTICIQHWIAIILTQTNIIHIQPSCIETMVMIV